MGDFPHSYPQSPTNTPLYSIYEHSSTPIPRLFSHKLYPIKKQGIIPVNFAKLLKTNFFEVVFAVFGAIAVVDVILTREFGAVFAIG